MNNDQRLNLIRTTWRKMRHTSTRAIKSTRLFRATDVVALPDRAQDALTRLTDDSGISADMQYNTALVLADLLE